MVLFFRQEAVTPILAQSLGSGYREDRKLSPPFQATGFSAVATASERVGESAAQLSPLIVIPIVSLYLGADGSTASNWIVSN